MMICTFGGRDGCGQADSIIISDLRQIVKLYHISEYLAGHKAALRQAIKYDWRREMLAQHIFVSLLRLYTITQSRNIPK